MRFCHFNRVIYYYLCLLFQILDHVLSFLGKKDLKNCRLVSRFWQKRATPIFRVKHQTIAFGYNCREGPEAIEDFMEIMRSSTCFPYSRYVFYFLASDTIADNSTFLELLELVGSSILSLTIFLGR